MALRPLIIPVPEHQYERVEHSDRVFIRTTGSVRSTKYHYKRSTEVHRKADFEVVIDVPTIVAKLVAKAASSKGGRSSAFGGLVKCVRRKVVEIARIERTHPIPEGYEEVK